MDLKFDYKKGLLDSLIGKSAAESFRGDWQHTALGKLESHKNTKYGVCAACESVSTPPHRIRTLTPEAIKAKLTHVRIIKSGSDNNL